MILSALGAVHTRWIGVSRASPRVERFVNRNGVAANTQNVKEPTLLYLIRHCQSSGQEPDAPLTALGHQQAERLAEWLFPLGVARIVSSTYLRARQSVEPLARRLSLAVETDDRLIERLLSPEPLDDWRTHLHAAWADHDLALPGGESSRQATMRGIDRK